MIRLAWMALVLVTALAAQSKTQSKKGPPPPQDLSAIKNEQPDRRYWSALEFASGRIDRARRNYQEGKVEEFRKDIGDIATAVQLTDDTLRANGRNPSKSPRHFKRAELKEREIVRRLRTFEDEVNVEDRDVITKTRTHVSDLHDELLFDIMGRKK